MIIRNFLDSPNIFDYSDNKNIKSLNIQVNLTHILKDSINFEHYHSYLLTIGLIRNQIFLYKKLKKHIIKTKNIDKIKIKIKNQVFLDINLMLIYKGLRKIYNLTYKQSLRIINNLLNSIYITNISTKNIKTIKNLENIYINVKSVSNYYHDKDIIVPFIVKKDTKLDFKNFRKHVVFMLASIPLVKEKLNKSEKNKITLKTNISYEKIAKVLNLSKSHVSKILKNNEKIYLFEESTETEYNYQKYNNNGTYIYKIYISKNEFKYYKLKGVYNYNKYKWQYYIRIYGKNKKTKKLTDRFYNTFNRKGGLHGNYLFKKLFTGEIYTKEYNKDIENLKNELGIEEKQKYKKLLGITEKNLKEAIRLLNKLVYNINTIEKTQILEQIFNKYNKLPYIKIDINKKLNLVRKKSVKSINKKSLIGLKNAINNKKVQKFLNIKKFLVDIYLRKKITEFDKLSKKEKEIILNSLKNNEMNKELQQGKNTDIMFISLANKVIDNFIYIIKKYKKYNINKIKYTYFKYLINYQ